MSCDTTWPPIFTSVVTTSVEVGSGWVTTCGSISIFIGGSRCPSVMLMLTWRVT